ncbi:MAG: extracellular solute-binding protein [Chloroflexi bacterium]|nr:extracellular solute-binding protein [Chloroflexota bacterium]
MVWNGRDVRTLLVPALEAGESIDLVDNDTGFIAANFAQYALSLDDLLEQPALDYDGSVRSSIIEALLTQYPAEDGSIISVPYNPFAVMFLYNKDHFADAGITELPETWDEFLAVNQALLDAGHAPITTDIDAYIDIIMGYYAQRAVGCDALTAAMTDTTGEAWNDPAYLQMAQDIRGLWDAGFIAPGTEGNLYPAGQQMVALDEVTMYLNGTWLPAEVQETTGPDFPWGAFNFPTVNGGVGAASDIMMGSQGVMILNSSEHPQEAFELIKYMVSEKAQSAMVSGSQRASRSYECGMGWRFS